VESGGEVRDLTSLQKNVEEKNPVKMPNPQRRTVISRYGY
jgi:hypothetical protein